MKDVLHVGIASGVARKCDFSRASTAFLEASSSGSDLNDSRGAINDLSSPVPGVFGVVDLELLHHFITSTYFTLSPDPILRNLCRVNLPQLGFQHEYVLHGILSVAALHLGRFSPSKKEYYVTRAIQHHNASSAIALPILSAVNPENAAPLYIFSILTWIFALAQPRQPNDFPAGSEVVPEWVLLFRGARSIVDMARESIRSSPLAAIVASPQSPSMGAGGEPMANEGLKELENNIRSRSTCYTLQKSAAIFHALGALKQTFAANNIRDGIGDVRGIVKWVRCVSDDYLTLLKDKDSEALCIFAYFCVVLRMLDSVWWIEGWAKYLIERIYYLLDDVYRLWIRWPVEEIGWVPGQ